MATWDRARRQVHALADGRQGRARALSAFSSAHACCCTPSSVMASCRRRTTNVCARSAVSTVLQHRLESTAARAHLRHVQLVEPRAARLHGGASRHAAGASIDRVSKHAHAAARRGHASQQRTRQQRWPPRSSVAAGGARPGRGDTPPRARRPRLSRPPARWRSRQASSASATGLRPPAARTRPAPAACRPAPRSALRNGAEAVRRQRAMRGQRRTPWSTARTFVRSGGSLGRQARRHTLQAPHVSDESQRRAFAAASHLAAGLDARGGVARIARTRHRSCGTPRLRAAPAAGERAHGLRTGVRE